MKDVIVTVSSLEKVFPNTKPSLLQSEYSVFRNERFHFQVACYASEQESDCQVQVTSPINEHIKVRVVEPVPSYLSQIKGNNDDYIILQENASTLYPDILRDIRSQGECLRQKMWTSFWVTVNEEEKSLPTGTYEIEIMVKVGKNAREFGTCKFTLHVLDAELPKTDLIYTNWFHYDCIAYQHKVEMFSKEFYEVFNEYLDSAISHGMNMLYTPLFTPPLDTKVGAERATAQLVDVTVRDGVYSFGFDKLLYFMKNAKAHGIEYFELSHLATQWGAYYCPKIVADVDGQRKKIFGWEQSSVGAEYTAFLHSFLAQLAKFMEQNGFTHLVRFHISDEPCLDDLERFSSLHNIILQYFPKAIIMDALHNLDFWEKGIVNCPVVATQHTEPFLEKGTLEWVYYCSWQRHSYLSNRFFNMPSQRNRILGLQLYRNGVRGFLHWGFNFYNSVLSQYPINPYLTTDAGGGFESGDSFIVYPTEKGVLETLRHEVLYDGFNDYRAMKLYESLVGKERAIALLEENDVRGFSEYPKSAQWHLNFRLQLNEEICKKLQNK